MVEHLPRGPEFEPIVDPPRTALPRGEGPCLVCGEWIDAEADEVYGVVVTRDDGERASLVAHGRCLASVAHASVRLPGFTVS